MPAARQTPTTTGRWKWTFAPVPPRTSPAGGWASSDAWPYYNLQWPDEGLIIAIGWPGQWASNFSRDQQDGLRITAGQETTHFKLLPGEEVRSPLIALQFWQGGDWIPRRTSGGAG